MSGLGKAIERKRRTVETLEPPYRLVWTQEPFVHEIDREAQRGTRRAFGSTRLENPKLSVFDGELYVLDITEAAFKSRKHIAQLSSKIGHCLVDGRLGSRRSPSRDNVLALGIDQKIDHRSGVAGRRIA